MLFVFFGGNMHYHKEGYTIIAVSTALILLLNVLIFKLLGPYPIVKYFLCAASLVFLYLIIQFFRVPHRTKTLGDDIVIAPAVGIVVVIVVYLC